MLLDLEISSILYFCSKVKKSKIFDIFFMDIVCSFKIIVESAWKLVRFKINTKVGVWSWIKSESSTIFNFA